MHVPFLRCVWIASFWPSTAGADVEAWFSFEVRLPLAESDGVPERTSLRLVSEERFRSRSDGLGQMLFRFGPRFDLTNWFYVVAQPALYVERSNDGEFLQGVRAEVEPTFSFDVGDVALSDRSRIAYRWETDDTTWYYRNMLRVEYDTGSLFPFIWGEFFFDPGRPRIDQYRLMGGLALETSASTSLEPGYLYRARLDEGAWEHDHVAALYVTYDGWE